MSTQEMTDLVARCTLCPAGCPVELAAAGPDAWHMEYPPAESGGLCPRGSTLGELVSHRLRVLTAEVREPDGLRSVEIPAALRTVAEAVGGGDVTILLDGNLPCEQLLEAAAWCNAWPQAKLCLVVEPADRQLLLGTEAGGAGYLADDDLAGCDGFLIIGDAFAANPVCSRGFFDRRRSHPRTPVVVLDPGCGTASKFATHPVAAGAGQELPALAAIAGAAVATADVPAAEALPDAAAAGKALAGCKRLGVLIAAEYGRTHRWRQIGYLAGRLAASLGGGVAPQTTGANALAAVRMADKLQTISLGEALASDAPKVAVGCDVVGMLGGIPPEVLAAAAALPNQTTDRARVLLPAAMPGEFGGTYLLAGAKPTEVAAVMPAPAGIATPGGVVAALAAAAGVAQPQISSDLPLDRLTGPAPQAAPPEEDRPAPVLLLGRQVIHDGCGALTGHGSWQVAVQPTPAVRICPEYAARLNLKNLSVVQVQAGEQREALQGRVRYSPELPVGTVVLPEGLASCRAMMPGRIDPQTQSIVYKPAAVEVSS